MNAPVKVCRWCRGAGWYWTADTFGDGGVKEPCDACDAWEKSCRK